MTPQERLRKFRYRFDLTPVEANRLAGWPKATWWLAETGKIDPPENWRERLNVLTARLAQALTAPVKQCQHCKKHVKAWVESGGTHCPYCNRPFRRPRRAKVFPYIKRPQPTGDDLDRKALEELGYTVDYKQKRKRRE